MFGSRPLSFGRMRTLVQVVYAGMMGVLVTVAVVVYLYMGQLEVSERLPSNALLVAGVVVSVAAIVLCALLRRLVVRRVDPADVPLRLQAMVWSRLMFAAALEGAGIYWAVLAFLLQDRLPLAGAGVAAVLLAANYPTTARIEAEMELSEERLENDLEARQRRG